MRPGGRYPSPGLITGCCLSLVAIGCVAAGSYIVTTIVH